MKMRHRLHNLEFKRPTSVPERGPRLDKTGATCHLATLEASRCTCVCGCRQTECADGRSLCVAGVESEPQPARAPKTPVQLVSGQCCANLKGSMFASESEVERIALITGVLEQLWQTCVDERCWCLCWRKHGSASSVRVHPFVAARLPRSEDSFSL